jgi:hypothetical protein
MISANSAGMQKTRGNSPRISTLKPSVRPTSPALSRISAAGSIQAEASPDWPILA